MPTLIPSAGLFQSIGLAIDKNSSAAPSGGVKWSDGDVLNTVAVGFVGIGLGFVAAHEIAQAIKSAMR